MKKEFTYTQTEMIIRIAIAEDHEIVRSGIVRLLGEIQNFNIVGEFENGQELITSLEKNPVDVAILDVDMPVLNGIETLKIIQSDYPDTKTLILTMHHEPEFISQLLALGMRGYLPKNCGVNELILAINTIHLKGRYYNEFVTEALINNVASHSENNTTKLTDREKQIVKYLCEGKTNKEIADSLYLSFRTIEVHRKNIARKINTNNVQGVIKYAVEHGLYKYP